ncbi:ATP-grasp domain-containing protein [Shewanella chilikensis]|uniref:ATP-grasp domain-containing protein n=1 Tax=Shewanella chilikensis TaxID=558541 RepID=UPI003A96F1D1
MSHTHKNLLIIGAGVEAYEGIKIAKSMGLGLIVVDGNAQAPGLALADWSIVESTYNGLAILKKVQELISCGIKVDGVIAMCADVPVSVATLTTALDLPGLSLESAHLVADKLAMKQRLHESGIPIPKFEPVASCKEVMAAAEYVGLPLVIKPVDSRGARGVLLLDHPEQFEWAFHTAQKESPTGRVMVEEYLPGPQISTETLIDDGRCHTLGFSDRNYEWLEKTRPYIIENGGDAPTSLTDAQQRDVVDTVERAALALGIHRGVAKGDMVLTPEGAKVIEIAGRLSGGYFSTTQIPLFTGVPFIEMAIRLALGEHLPPEAVVPRQQQAVAIRYLDLPAGTLTSLDGIDNANSAPGVHMLKLFVEAGDTLTAVENHTQRAGFVITTGADKLQAIERAHNALALVKVSYAQE